jgi:CBS domain-containing protein
MLRLRDIMATEVVAISSEASVREAMELLSQHHVSGAPVVNGSTLVGAVSATDLMELTCVSSSSTATTASCSDNGYLTEQSIMKALEDPCRGD